MLFNSRKSNHILSNVTTSLINTLLISRFAFSIASVDHIIQRDQKA